MMNEPQDTNTVDFRLNLSLPKAKLGKWSKPDCQLIEDTGSNGYFQPVSRAEKSIIKIDSGWPLLQSDFNITIAPKNGELELFCIVDAPMEIEKKSNKDLLVRFDFVGAGGAHSRGTEKYTYDFLDIPRLGSMSIVRTSGNPKAIEKGLHAEIYNAKLPVSGPSQDPLVLTFSGANVEYIAKDESAKKKTFCNIAIEDVTNTSIRIGDADGFIHNRQLYIPMTYSLLQRLNAHMGVGNGLSGDPEDYIHNILYVTCPEISSFSSPPGAIGFTGIHLMRDGNNFRINRKEPPTEILSAIYSTLEYNNGLMKIPGIEKHIVRPVDKQVDAAMLNRSSRENSRIAMNERIRNNVPVNSRNPYSSILYLDSSDGLEGSSDTIPLAVSFISSTYTIILYIFIILCGIFVILL